MHNSFDLSVRLLSSSEKGDLRDVRELVANQGADVNFQDLRGRTPLYVAIVNGRYDVIRFLLEHGADVDMKCGDRVASVQKDLPIKFAVVSGEEFVINAFADAGTVHNNILMRMLEIAEQIDKTAVIERILNLGYPEDFYGKGADGRGVLHYAALYSDSKVMKRLLGYSGYEDREFSAETIDMRDNLGNTPLHLAAEKGNVDAMRFLMECGADVKAENKAGETPLYCSVKSGNVHAIDFMLGHRVEPYDRKALLTQVGPGQNDVRNYLQNKFQEIDNSDTTPQMRM